MNVDFSVKFITEGDSLKGTYEASRELYCHYRILNIIIPQSALH